MEDATGGGGGGVHSPPTKLYSASRPGGPWAFGQRSAGTWPVLDSIPAGAVATRPRAAPPNPRYPGSIRIDRNLTAVDSGGEAHEAARRRAAPARTARLQEEGNEGGGQHALAEVPRVAARVGPLAKPAAPRLKGGLASVPARTLLPRVAHTHTHLPKLGVNRRRVKRRASRGGGLASALHNFTVS